MRAPNKAAGTKQKVGDDDVVHKCLAGSLVASEMATALLLVEKQDAKHLHAALTKTINGKHNWELKTDSINITALPSWTEPGFYIL
jgi:hypothetical protein